MGAKGRSSEGMTIDEVRPHIRRKWGFFECPKKSDRLYLTDEHWAQMDWTDEEREINAALPHKLWGIRHDDYLWPFCKRFRGSNAYGYRAGEGHAKYLPRIPRLVKGTGIARWMTSGDKSIVYVPTLAIQDIIWTPETLPAAIDYVETKPGHSKQGREGSLPKKEFLELYAPSPLQKFTETSWLWVEPKHFSWHKMIDWVEYRPENPVREEGAKDLVMFHRRGARYDSGDEYYTMGAFYIGLRWN